MNLIILSYIIMVISSVCMILTSNPVYGLKFLIIIFLNFSFLLVYFNVSYLGFIFIMVYVGAVTILFLFVVMMLDIKHSVMNVQNYATIGFFFTFVLSIIIFIVLNNYSIDALSYQLNTDFVNNLNYQVSELHVLTKIGLIILNNHPIGILLVAFLLLIATIGAIYITYLAETNQVRKQYSQNKINNNYFLSLYK